jgi:hypothetical protein
MVGYKDSRISSKNNHQRMIVVLLYESPEGYLGSRMDGFYKDSRNSLKNKPSTNDWCFVV